MPMLLFTFKHSMHKCCDYFPSFDDFIVCQEHAGQNETLMQLAHSTKTLLYVLVLFMFSQSRGRDSALDNQMACLTTILHGDLNYLFIQRPNGHGR